MTAAASPTRKFESILRQAFELGRFDALAPGYAGDSLLESWVGGCHQFRGSAAIVAHLDLAWRGAAPLSHWQVSSSPGGYEIDVQRALEAGSREELAQRHLLLLGSDGRVYLHLVYPASVRRPADGVFHSFASLLRGLVRLQPLQDGTSGGSVQRAYLRDGSTLVVKYVSPASDWLMRATRDRGREALLWRSGLLPALPPGLATALLSVHEHEDGWVIVMRDVEPALRAFRRDATRLVPCVFRSAKALHALPPPADSSMLCTCADRLRLFSPLRPYLEWRERDTIPKTLTRMWQTFADLPAKDVVDAVLSCANDPSGLLERLARLPQRLLHGDLRFPNIGWDGRAIVLLDWGLACLGPVELDAVAFLCDATFWSEAEPGDLLAIWSPDGGEALDLAFIFQAVMGELAFLAHELAQRPAGATRLSRERLAWWIARTSSAFERAGL